MKQKKTLFSPFALALLTTLIVTMGCSLFTLKLPDVVNHPQPQLKVDTQPFVDAGCSQGNGMSRCPPDSPLGNLGCLAIGNPEDYLGGLTPAYPINICLTRSPSPAQPLAEDQFIYKDGCMVRNYIRYVIYKDDQFQLITSLEALQETYAPIETEEEALSFAAAASGLSANFGMETNRKYQYFVEKIERFLCPES